MAHKLLPLLVLLLSGCAELPESLKNLDPRSHPDQAAYEESIAPYLSQAKIYSGPVTGLIITALPLSPGVRAAQVERQSKAHGLSAAQQGQLLQDQAAQARLSLDIMVSVFTPEPNDSKLNFKNPSWRIYIQLPDNSQHDPIDVREVKNRERNAMLMALYPFWGDWDHLFRLRFAPLPGLTEGQSPLLVFSGPEGRGQLTLKLD